MLLLEDHACVNMQLLPRSPLIHVYRSQLANLTVGQAYESRGTLPCAGSRSDISST